MRKVGDDRMIKCAVLDEIGRKTAVTTKNAMTANQLTLRLVVGTLNSGGKVEEIVLSENEVRKLNDFIDQALFAD